MRILLGLCAILIPNLLLAGPYNEGILTLGKRDFYVGQTDWEPTNLRIPRFYFADSEWLKSIWQADPILRDHTLFMQQTGIPSRQQMDRNRPSESRYRLLETDPDYLSDGYRVNRTIGGLSIALTPISSDLDYMVVCSDSNKRKKIMACSLKVVYPHSTHVILTARISYVLAGGIPLPVYAARVEGIAQRLVQFVSCLDVTDREPTDHLAHISHLPSDNPDFESCKMAFLF